MLKLSGYFLTEQNKNKKQPDLGWSFVISNDNEDEHTSEFTHEYEHNAMRQLQPMRALIRIRKCFWQLQPQSMPCEVYNYYYLYTFARAHGSPEKIKCREQMQRTEFRNVVQQLRETNKDPSSRVR